MILMLMMLSILITMYRLAIIWISFRLIGSRCRTILLLRLPLLLIHLGLLRKKVFKIGTTKLESYVLLVYYNCALGVLLVIEFFSRVKSTTIVIILLLLWFWINDNLLLLSTIGLLLKWVVSIARVLVTHMMVSWLVFLASG